MSRTLYIIGNGFDRYHKLETRYQSFALFLQKKHPDIYELLIEYFGLPDLDASDPDSLYDPLWAEFENALADLDFQTVLEDNSDFAANPGSEDFKDRDWHSYQIEMEMVVKKLTNELRTAFRQFILAVEFPEVPEDHLLGFGLDPIFLNFNYTDTLETYYHVHRNRILYIHGKAKLPDEGIVLGHGRNPEEFKVDQVKEPDGLNEEQLEQWRDYMSDQFDFSYESAKDEILSYFNDSFKSTSEIIEKRKSFFLGLQTIEDVIVLGHSISPVDQLYIKKVLDSINNEKTIWTVTYYSESEKNSHKEKLLSLGLKEQQINMVKMESLRRQLPSLFD